ncbi:hypothetical protein AB0J48_12750 [Nocardia salmonicida]|uniref:hypothetical protein n=1 Tax=Nocardia salmonicida TaxID=53431 RepID=UPI0034338B1F
MTAGFQRALDTTRSSAGEGIHADIQLEFLAEEGRADSCGGDLGGEVGAQFGDGAPDDFARELARGRRRDIAERAGAAAEQAACRAADCAAESGEAQIGPAEFVAGAVALGYLDQSCAEVGAALFECFERGATQSQPGGCLRGAAGEHAGDELSDRHTYRDLGGHSGCDAGYSADTCPRSRDRRTDLHRGDDHRRDDHQFGVLDIVGAVFE